MKIFRCKLSYNVYSAFENRQPNTGDNEDDSQNERRWHKMWVNENVVSNFNSCVSCAIKIVLHIVCIQLSFMMILKLIIIISIKMNEITDVSSWRITHSPCKYIPTTKNWLCICQQQTFFLSIYTLLKHSLPMPYSFSYFFISSAHAQRPIEAKNLFQHKCLNSSTHCVAVARKNTETKSQTA